MRHSGALKSWNCFPAVPRHRNVLRTLIPLLVIIGVIIAIDLAIPIFLRNYVNQVLNRSPEYNGKVESIDADIWRGAYTLKNVVIEKSSGKVPVPLFRAPRFDLSVEWRELLHGAFVGEVLIERPVVNFVGGEGEAATQNGEEEDWTQLVKDLFPLKINSLTVHDGDIHYRDFGSHPKIDIYLTKAEVIATNLTNSLKLSRTLNARIDATAYAQKSGMLKVNLELDPYAAEPTFQLIASLKNLNLNELNDFFRAYAAFDVKKGIISIYSELKVDKGQVDGYIKPLATDMVVLDLDKDLRKPLRFIWETIVATVNAIFTNPSKDQIASKIPISGTLENPEAGVIRTIIELIRNAFVEALTEGVDKDFERLDYTK